MGNFVDQQVNNGDLDALDKDDLKELIPKMGPRKRFKKWLEENQGNDD